MIYDILLGFFLLFILSGGVAWYISSRIILQPRDLRKEDWKQYALWPQPVNFFTSDGLKLAGVFIEGTGDTTIILLHGYGRSKEQLLPQASFLNKAGYNIFMFDFRASGESEGKYITFGQREQRDLVGALEYLRTQKNVNQEKIGLLGFSMGGAVALMKSGDLPEIKAMVITSTYANFKTVIWNNFRRYLRGVPFFPLGYFTLWIIKFRTGCYLPTISPIRYIHKLKARPLMIIHSEYDKRVPIEDALEFYKKAPWLKEFWLVRDAHHGDIYSISKDQYEDKVTTFFDRYIMNS